MASRRASLGISLAGLLALGIPAAAQTQECTPVTLVRHTAGVRYETVQIEGKEVMVAQHGDLRIVLGYLQAKDDDTLRVQPLPVSINGTVDYAAKQRFDAQIGGTTAYTRCTPK